MLAGATPAILTSQSDARRKRRRPVRLQASTSSEGAAANLVSVYDISEHGLLLETNAALTLGERIYLDLPRADQVPATIIWASAHFYGCKFDMPISAAAVSAAVLKATPLPQRAGPMEVERLHSTPALEEGLPSSSSSAERFSPPARIVIVSALALISWGFTVAAVSAIASLV